MNVQWTVGKKIAAGYGLALVLLLIVGGISYRGMDLLVDNAWWVAHTHQVLEQLEGIQSLLKGAEGGQRGFLLTGDATFLESYHQAEQVIPQRLQKVRELTADNKTQQRRVDELDALVRKRLARLRDGIDCRRQDPPGQDAAVADAKGLKAALKIATAEQTRSLMEQVRRTTEEMQEEERKLLSDRSKTEADAVALTRWTIILGTLVSVVSLFAVGIFLTRSITQPLSAAAAMARKIADGDLRQEKLAITSQDETGQLAVASNLMLDSLCALNGQIAAITRNLGAAAAEILSSIQEQAASTREQAATVQQISTTMGEISQSGAQISGRAKQVATAAEATSAASTSGMQAVQDTTRTMGSIREQVEEVAENVVALSEKTQAIGEIIATVNDIAERSNLLALNASIEAAAAGEQGNRFSVVAQEMKNLSDQAKDSTVQVRTILSDIQKGINSSVMLTEEAVKRVDIGKQQADVTEQTIRQMAQTTLESIQAFEQIIGAGSQQQIGFEQVTQGMKDIRQAATQTAAATAQMEQAAANLGSLSQELKQAVSRYKV